MANASRLCTRCCRWTSSACTFSCRTADNTEERTMNYPSVRIEGSIFSPDILDRLEDTIGQRPADFDFDASIKVKDEIARACADAQDYWRIFQRKLESLKADFPATTETRNNWIVPLLGLLGYQLEYQARGTEVNGKNYPISHRVINRGHIAIHIVGY